MYNYYVYVQGYELRILVTDEDGKKKYDIGIGSAFAISHQCLDVTTNNSYFIFRWYNAALEKCSEIVPSQILTGNNFIAFLAKHGLVYERSYHNNINDYAAKGFQDAKVKCIHTRLGFNSFNNPTVFYGYESIGAGICSMHYCADAKDNISPLKPNGDLGAWLDGVRKHIIGNASAETMILMGYASPIYTLFSGETNIPTAIIDICAQSSSGKTTFIKAISSIYGCPSKLVTSFNMTAGVTNKIFEGKIGFTPAFIDESTVLNDKEIQDLIYKSSGGQSKMRLNRDGTIMKNTADWAGLGFLTEEKPLLSTPDLHEGCFTRVVTCNCQLTTSAKNAHDIEKFTSENYGVAYQDFIQFVLNNYGTVLQDYFNEAFEKLHNAYIATCGSKDDNVNQRLIRLLTSVLVAGRVVNHVYAMNFDLEAVTEVLVGFVQSNTRLRFKEGEWDEMVIQRIWENYRYYIISSDNLSDKNRFAVPEESCHGRIVKTPDKATGQNHVKIEIKASAFRKYCNDLKVDKDKLIAYYISQNRILQSEKDSSCPTGFRYDVKVRFNKTRPRCYVIDMGYEEADDKKIRHKIVSIDDFMDN